MGHPPSCPVSFLLSPLPSPYPISPFAAARECVCPLPLVFGPSSVVSLLCFALLPVLPCAVCFSACQGWVTVCFLLPPLKFSFLCSACLLCAPLPVSCLRCLSSYFPVAGCGRLSLFPPSPACVCEAPNKTRHLSSDSTSPDQCLVFCTTDFTDSLDILVRWNWNIWTLTLGSRLQNWFVHIILTSKIPSFWILSWCSVTEGKKQVHISHFCPYHKGLYEWNPLLESCGQELLSQRLLCHIQQGAPLADCTQRSYCHDEGEANHLCTCAISVWTVEQAVQVRGSA